MKQQNYKFKASDFYFLLESQEFRCPLSGRELTPENCTASHIVPVRRGGAHALENIYLIVDSVTQIKRNMLDDELVALCVDIVQNVGVSHGFKVSKLRSKGRRR